MSQPEFDLLSDPDSRVALCLAHLKRGLVVTRNDFALCVSDEFRDALTIELSGKPYPGPLAFFSDAAVMPTRSELQAIRPVLRRLMVAGVLHEATVLTYDEVDLRRMRPGPVYWSMGRGESTEKLRYEHPVLAHGRALDFAVPTAFVLQADTLHHCVGSNGRYVPTKVYTTDAAHAEMLNSWDEKSPDYSAEHKLLGMSQLYLAQRLLRSYLYFPRHGLTHFAFDLKSPWTSSLSNRVPLAYYPVEDTGVFAVYAGLMCSADELFLIDKHFKTHYLKPESEPEPVDIRAELAAGRTNFCSGYMVF